MKKKLTAEERLERLRLLAERHDLDRLVQKTPSQLRRMSELDQVLETSRTNRPAAAASARG